MNKVIIMVGVPGSGKSTLIKKQRKECPLVTVSADYYPGLYDAEGKFHIEHLAAAHQTCLKEFTALVTADKGKGLAPELLMVDNTNSTVLEAAPYISLALAYGWDVGIAILKCPTDIAYERNVHGVPQARIEAMAANIEAQWPGALPWHWRPENEPRISIDLLNGVTGELFEGEER